jgi:hypothetical protein
MAGEEEEEEEEGKREPLVWGLGWIGWMEAKHNREIKFHC